MDPGTKRRIRRSLPDLSGQNLSVVMALFAVLGFLGAAAPALFGNSSPRESVFNRTATSSSPVTLPSRTAVSRSLHSRAASSATLRPASTLLPAPGELLASQPPRVLRVWFTEGAASVARDLRLHVAVSDPDSDVLQLHTTWRIDGREVPTDTPVLPRAQLARGAHVQATVIASDGSDESEPVRSPEIVVGNAPPLITSFPGAFDAAGDFVYEVVAKDPDGDAAQLRLVEGPSGMQLDPSDRTLRWSPSKHAAGRHRVRVEVRDGHGGSHVQHFELDVRAPAREPSELADRIAPG